MFSQLSFEADKELMPIKRPHGKRRRGSMNFGGDGGVGDPPSPWEWIVEATVKEGSEKKGSINAVMGAAIKTVKNISLLRL
jgi:hypothetical protein